MPAPIRHIVRAAYGDATGHIFLISAVVAVVALLAVLFIKEVPLRTTVWIGESTGNASAGGGGHRLPGGGGRAVGHHRGPRRRDAR